MEQPETRKDNNDESVESVADLEVSREQSEEIQAGLKLEDIYVTSFQTGGSGHAD